VLLVHTLGGLFDIAAALDADSVKSGRVSA
jgi:hypothetical protein